MGGQGFVMMGRLDGPGTLGDVSDSGRASSVVYIMATASGKGA